MNISAAIRLEIGSRGQDRVAIEHIGERTLIVVADGAGGTGGGAEAAQTACDAVTAAFRAAGAQRIDWTTRLAEIDASLMRADRGGSTTAVIVDVTGDVIEGASVGDSAVWMVSAGVTLDLTASQIRKPLLGSGHAQPVAFGPVPLQGRLLVGTDGLFNYAPAAHLLHAASAGTLDAAVSALVDAVRLRSGGFHDDVAVVLAEGCATAG